MVSIKLRMKEKNVPKHQNPCLQLTEFEYPTEAKRQRRTNCSPLNVLGMRSSLKTLVPAPSNEPFAETLCLQIGSARRAESQDRSITPHPLFVTSKVLPEWIRPRDQKYEHAPYIFHRFSYENYTNYNYQNPFRPHKCSQSDSVMKPPRFNFRKGKTLEVVYCEQKMPEFLKLATAQLNKPSYQITQKALKKLKDYSPDVKINLPVNNPEDHSKKDSQRQIKSSRIKKTTTLAAYLTQFATLEKLSIFMERERNMIQNNLLLSQENPPKGTVLLEIIVHRFEFLKKLSQSMCLTIFRVLFGFQADLKAKINLQQYLHLTQIFVNRDADNQTVATFLYDICAYPNHLFDLQKVTLFLHKFKAPNAVKKNKICRIVEKILEEAPPNATKEMIVFEIQSNLSLLKDFIDLFINT